tara:strand:- start:65958 stop:67343 length:1386 start_codon:yes stop_codon:yes gene_type:complete
MKENQIIIALFIILGLFAVYFFSQSSLFNEETNISEPSPSLLQPINPEVSEIPVNSNDSVNSQPIIEPVEEEVILIEDPVVNQNISPNPIPEIPLSQTYSCPKSNFLPQPNSYLIYDIIGLEKLTVVFGEISDNEINVTLTVSNTNSTWFIADLESRAIISGPEEQIIGNVPLFWLPMYYNVGDTITSLGDIELNVVSEDSMMFDNKNINTLVVQGKTIQNNENNRTESVITSYYDKNTGILLQINEQSSTYDDENIIDEQSINIINVIETNIDFTNYSVELISHDVVFEFNSFIIYEHDNFNWKLEFTLLDDSSVNITESRSFFENDWEVMRWRIVDLNCFIIKDAHTNAFDQDSQTTPYLLGKSYEFLIRSDLSIGNYIFPAYEDIGLGLDVSVFRIIDIREFNYNGEIFNVVVAESLGDNGIVRRYFDTITGIMLLEEFEYEGIIKPILSLKESGLND